MNDATDTTRGSRRSMCSRLSATFAVRSMAAPDGRYISTANWLRSAVGIICCGNVSMSMMPATAVASPAATVAFGQRKQKPMSRL